MYESTSLKSYQTFCYKNNISNNSYRIILLLIILLMDLSMNIFNTIFQQTLFNYFVFIPLKLDEYEMIDSTYFYHKN